MTVDYTLGTSAFDNFPSPRELGTIDEFFETILSARHTATPSDKAAGRVPYFAGTFGHDESGQHRRCVDGAQPRAWLGLDIDYLTPAAALLLMPILARWRGIWYGTMSATPADLRRRVILALDREASVAELPRVALAVESWLMQRVPDGIKFDQGASSDVARLWYLPHLDAESGEFHGNPVNVAGALAQAPPVLAGQAAGAVVPDADLRLRIANGVEVHDAITRIAARLTARGMVQDEVIATIQGMFDPAPAWAQADPRRYRERVAEIPRAVHSAQRRFARNEHGQPAPPRGEVDEAAVEAWVTSVVRYSHNAGADAVLRTAGANLRFVTNNKKWAFWDGRHWDLDSRMAHDAVHRTAQRMAQNAYNDPALTPAQRDNIGRKCDSAEFRNGVRTVCEHEISCCVRPGDFDTNPFLLNTPSALLDLRSGQAIPDRREHLVSKMTAVDPVTDAHEGTRFALFMREITGGNYETESFLQRALGACLFGMTATADAWLLFCIGTGRNGKSLLMESVSHAMGSYAGKIASNVLLAQENGERHPTEIANLRGLRLAYAAEIDEGKRWNESRIKELTGDKVITARVMRGDPFEFDVTHRFVIAANHRPMMSNPDVALRARLRMVPFLQSFAGREETGLHEKLFSEAPIVLGWLMRGAAVFWQRHRLDGCEQSNAETEAYFTVHSTADSWLEERCTIDEFSNETTAALYADFRNWKEARGEGSPGIIRFAERLNRDPRFKQVRLGTVRGLRGIRLNAPNHFFNSEN